MIYKQCTRCGKTIPEGEDCPTCKRIYEKPEGTRRLYHTSRWAKLRQTVLSLHGGVDPWAAMHGRIAYADTVHHIETAEERPDLFWRGDNLVPVDRQSHDEIHALYRESEDVKRKTKEELRKLVKELKL